MNRIPLFTLAAVALLSVAFAADAPAEPRLGSFEATKCGGAPDDGAAEGQELCYFCKRGARPTVMVFARGVSAQLTDLVRTLDDLAEQYESERFGVVVNLLGDDPAALAAAGKEFAIRADLDRVAVAVPREHRDGPAEYKLSDEEVTVIVYRLGKIHATHALAFRDLDAERIGRIAADARELLE